VAPIRRPTRPTVYGNDVCRSQPSASSEYVRFDNRGNGGRWKPGTDKV
jgi:hypothetical protein